MNALLWFIALMGSIALAYLFFTEYSGATFTMIGWLCIGLALLCVVETTFSIVDDSQDVTQRWGF